MKFYHLLGWKYTGCTLKLRAVKLLFVIFGRLSYTFFVKIMILGNGRLSYILWKNGRFLAENDRFSDRFLARGGSNGISNDVFSISVIKNCIYNKGKLISAKITAQNSGIRGNFAWITFFSLWTVKLLFVIFGRLSYTFFTDKICNLSVQPVY